MRALRVATYNVRDLRDDASAAARVVRAVAPDVLCLQEVPRRLLGAHRVASFAARCGMYWPGGHRGSGGTTILTSLRVQVRGSAHHSLAVPLLQRTRGYAVARVRTPGGPALTVASVHLSLDPAERERHAEQILEAVTGDTERVVAGDLNEGHSGAAWQRIAASLRLVSPTAPTFPARAPRSLLDVIFASPGLVASHTEVPLDRADLVAASDHLPVWVDVVPGPGSGPQTRAPSSGSSSSRECG